MVAPKKNRFDDGKSVPGHVAPPPAGSIADLSGSSISRSGRSREEGGLVAGAENQSYTRRACFLAHLPRIGLFVAANQA
jgi:hypothetical protein